jgi:heptosyltransferase-2
VRKGYIGSSTICRSGHEELLVLAPNWLGDAVMATPFLIALRQRFPSAGITVLSREYAAELFPRNGAIDSLVTSRESVGARIAALRRVVPASGFDACFVLPPSFSAAFVSLLSKARRRIGFGDRWRRVLLTDVVTAALFRAEHLSAAYLMLLERFTGRAEPALPLPMVTPEDTWRETVDTIVGSDAYFVLAPGATYGAAKAWPQERYVALAGMLAGLTGWSPAIVGREEERGVASAILEGAGLRGKNLAGRLSIAQLVSILRGARLAVGNDSGPVHIAAALGVPTVAVFGPTSVNWTAPRGTAVRIVAGAIECAPCFKRECPRGAPECLIQIGAERVYEAAVSLIEEGSR